MSLLATKKKLNPNRRVQCFDIYGYDFILDNDFNTWLIEANTNPCLEESSELLKMLLPRMINDALKLSIDLIFKPGSENIDGSPIPSAQPYPVTGHPDSQNLWQIICSLNTNERGQHTNEECLSDSPYPIAQGADQHFLT